MPTGSAAPWFLVPTVSPGRLCRASQPVLGGLRMGAVVHVPMGPSTMEPFPGTRARPRPCVEASGRGHRLLAQPSKYKTTTSLRHAAAVNVAPPPPPAPPRPSRFKPPSRSRRSTPAAAAATAEPT
ncbi:hypothetical protein DCS_03573 [Drechmeria coniospora]|uniref:Uncharacterized protein n=1 Tax=Drechmeria coniospora TaxID=98403 RepID=A0A151GHQ9_DRECN|nr:hypothetical protein DCS_03573 [Drechmeria coniospora]KYK56572.1 hypothetical protein DCS_03573 [Drechmeria coniospora]